MIEHCTTPPLILYLSSSPFRQSLENHCVFPPTPFLDALKIDAASRTLSILHCNCIVQQVVRVVMAGTT